MGGAESCGSSGRVTPSDLHHPVVGTRMNDEKLMSHLRAAVHQGKNSKKNHIVRTSFTAILSQVNPSDGVYPFPRTGHFYANCKELDVTVVGFGVTAEDQYLDDIWILHPIERRWEQVTLTGTAISARSNARGVCVGHVLFVFGGFNDPNYFNDLYAIDLTTGECTEIATTGDKPSPRSAPVMATYDENIYIWGGYDGLWPSDLHVLSLQSLVWTATPQEIQGRTGVSFHQVGDKVYCFGASKTCGLLEIDLEKLTVQYATTTGPEPPSSIVNSTMIGFDRYLLVVGGKCELEYTLLYALDLIRKWWFVLHVLPDGESIAQADGYVNELGMFLVPRPHSMAAAYSEATKCIYAFLGFPEKEPAPLFILSVGEALGVMNMRLDMLQALGINKL